MGEQHPHNPISAVADRIPPHATEAEMASLGAMLISKSAIGRVQELVEPADFYHDGNRLICSAIYHLEGRDLPCDLLSVPEALKAKGLLERVGGVAYVNTLADSVPTAAHAEYYARTVKEKATLRKLIDASNEIIARAYEAGDTEEVDLLVDEAQAKVCAVADKRGAVEAKPASLWAPRASDRIINRDEGPVGIPSGISQLDRILRGFRRGHLVIVAARPSIGKTDLCVQISLNTATAGIPTLQCSLEMSEAELTTRYFANLTDINSVDLQTGTLAKEQAGDVQWAEHRLAALPLFISDEEELPLPTLANLKAHIRRMVRKHGVQFVIIDQLQTIARPDRDRDNDNQFYTKVVYALKQLARELRIVIVLQCQLNRDLEKRENKRPLLHDLRDTGSIEQAADVVLTLYRQRYYDEAAAVEAGKPAEALEEGGEEADDEEEAEIIVRKQRQGPRNLTVKAQCRLSRSKWWTPDAYHDSLAHTAPPEDRRLGFG